MKRLLPTFLLLSACATSSKPDDPTAPTPPTDTPTDTATAPTPVVTLTDHTTPLCTPTPLTGTLPPGTADPPATLTLAGTPFDLTLDPGLDGAFALDLAALDLAATCPASQAPCDLDATLTVDLDEGIVTADAVLTLTADGTLRVYQDADADAYGDPDTTTLACPDALPDGLVTNDNDCDDGEATIYPGAIEVIGDDTDQDCDAEFDCYVDVDNDEYGTSTVVEITSPCSAPTNGGAANPDDCDDDFDTINPGELEAEGNDVDENCDDRRDCFVDEDEDGVSTSVVELAPLSVSCGSIGYTITQGNDCDDTDNGRFPGNTAGFCSGADSDCDPDEVDEWVYNASMDAVYEGANAGDQLTAALTDAALQDNDELQLCSSQTFEGTFTIDHAIDVVGSDGLAPDVVTFQQPTGGAGSVLTINTSGSVHINDATFIGSADSAAPEGGCLNVQAGDITLGSAYPDPVGFVTFETCHAAQGGASAVAAGSSLTWLGGSCTSSRATATHGGCVYSQGSVTLSEVQVADNESSENGGGLYLLSGSLDWWEGACQGNSALESGGCLYTLAGTNVLLGDSSGAIVDIVGGPTDANTAAIRGDQLVIGGTLDSVTDSRWRTSLNGGATEDVYIAGGVACWEGADVVSAVTVANSAAIATNAETSKYCNGYECLADCP